MTHWHHDHVGGVHDIHHQLQTLNGIPVSKFKRPEEPDARLVDDDVENENDDKDDDKNDNKVDYTFIQDKAVFATEGATLEALFTPGHTTDHVCLTLREESSLFAGDCILGEGSSVFEDLFDYMNSLDLILKAVPSVVYPGHGPVISDPIPAIKAYINHRNARETQILDALRGEKKKLTVEEIVGVVYPGLAENLLRGAANNVGHHLSKLEKEGKVVGREGRFESAERSG